MRICHDFRVKDDIKLLQVISEIFNNFFCIRIIIDSIYDQMILRDYNLFQILANKSKEVHQSKTI